MVYAYSGGGLSRAEFSLELGQISTESKLWLIDRSHKAKKMLSLPSLRFQWIWIVELRQIFAFETELEAFIIDLLSLLLLLLLPNFALCLPIPLFPKFITY